MDTFRIGAMRDWHPVEFGDATEVEVGAVGYRQVDFDLLSDVEVTVYVTTDNPRFPVFPVAVGKGLLNVTFTVHETCEVVVEGEGGCGVVFWRSKAISQKRRNPEGLPSYTRIEPRPQGPAPEVRRYMDLLKLNQLRRDAELADEMKAIRELREALGAEKAERAKARKAEEAGAGGPAPATGEAATDGLPSVETVAAKMKGASKA